MTQPAATLTPEKAWWRCLKSAALHLTEEWQVQSEPTRTTRVIGLSSLLVIWAVLLASTWATWGDITIDDGRELYVSWELTGGKVLYRDIWYSYTPGAPYLNSFLFRIFGSRMEVLYWAGSLSALACAALLYFIGARLSHWFIGWTAAAIVLGEAFLPNLFSFPLPYSYGAVYGALATCLFLWFAINASEHSRHWPLFASGIAASGALAFKPEFGVGCYAALFALIALRCCRSKSGRQMTRDVLTVLPGALLSAAMIAWMVSLKGPNFITAENISSWPTNYFMRTYGAYWLKTTGLAIDLHSLGRAAAGLCALLTYLGLGAIVRHCGLGRRIFIIGLSGVLGLLVLSVTGGWLGDVIARALLFPPSMVFLVVISIPFALIAAWQRQWSARLASIAILFIGASAVAIRTLFGTAPGGYSSYYNGPVLLAFLLLVDAIIFRAAKPLSSKRWLVRVPLYLGVLALAYIRVVQLEAHIRTSGEKSTLLKTERGALYMGHEKAQRYAAAIDFMKAAAASGQYTMSIPEDAGLYFFSGTHCPTRVFVFTPGIVAPGKMTDQEIRGMEQAHVRYLIWSNRVFPEYGVREFGVDFNQRLGVYLRSHFHPIRDLGESTTKGKWDATIWERIPEVSEP